MESYYVNDNAQPNGDHEVHERGCYWLGLTRSKTFLGNFSSCRPAVAEARRRGYNANGCYFCSRACHTG